jgi:hypothetical protein
VPHKNLELCCEHCGGNYKAAHKTQRFCSHACRAAATSAAAARPCGVDGCNQRACVRGWCDRHYRAWRRTGDPLGWKANAERRFWEKVEKGSGCWLWRGRLSGGGYGQFKVAGREAMAHRYAYELLVGAIPDGREIDHLCRVRACVNPAHLEAVTHSTNVSRSVPYWERTRPMPTCVDCGVPLSRRDAARCRPHAAENRRRST